MKPYKPIPCALHSEYELMIMRGSNQTWQWIGSDGQQQAVTGKAVDLLTHNGEEFLIIETDTHERHQVRLDWLSDDM